MPSLNTAPSRVPLPDRDEVEQFLFREARLLDERQFDAWRDLFAEDGLYWAPTRHAQASPDEAVSLFLDDRTTMAARIRRLSHPEVHLQSPPSRAVHLVSNIELGQEMEPDGTFSVFSAFSMAEYRQDDVRWYAGRVEHRLRRAAPGFKIVLKKVVLVNCSGAFTAMAVYF